MERNRHALKADVEAVITSYNQGEMVLEAVQSVCGQTLPPDRIIIVDDGSTDPDSLSVLERIQNDSQLPVPVTVYYQKNGGVSAARNAGIRMTRSAMVLILDGDDMLEAEYIEKVSKLLFDDPDMVIASSWMHTFGVLDAVVRPTGGNLVPFLSHSRCPATHIFRKSAYAQCAGFDETMRSGFEDWDFFLSMLETLPDAHIGIVESPLIRYRTAPASLNIKSMNRRIELMRYIIEKHGQSYGRHMIDVLLDIEAVSNARLLSLENEIIHAMKSDRTISEQTKRLLENPSFGDGGMASAVRIMSSKT